MEKRKYEVIITYKNYTVIKYQKGYIGDEYAVARNFDAENFSWDSSGDNYAYSFDAALACLLRRIGSDYVKNRNQLIIESNTGITYDRMCELATRFKDGLIETDEDYAMEFFKDECEMTDNEKEFFGIEIESEDEFDDSPAWEDDSDRGCKDCPPEECTGHCMSCYYRPV